MFDEIVNQIHLMKRMGMLNESVYKKMLCENPLLLTEAMTVDKAMQTFSNIPQDVFSVLLQIDPTYNGGGNVGKLFTWVANAYLQDQSIAENPEKSKEILSIFKNNQNRFTTPTNIKQFSNIEQIKQFLNQQGMLEEPENKDSFTNGIDNAAVREGTKVVFEGNTWRIIVPVNHQAAKHWGANTKWCTAGSENGQKYYNDYLEDYGGQYYILINKHNPNDKYQFHFESDQFMDTGDNQIGEDVYDLEDFDELNHFFSKEQGKNWALRVVKADTNENWQIDGDLGNGFQIESNPMGHHRIIDNYGNVVFGGDNNITYIGQISEYTGCAQFYDADNGYGLLCIPQGQIEVYVSGLSKIDDENILETSDGDREWYYVARTQDGEFKLITNYPSTFEYSYDNIIEKEDCLVVEINGEMGIMRNGFNIEQSWDVGDADINNIYGTNLVSIREYPSESTVIFNIQTGEKEPLPLKGQIRIYDNHWATGYVGTYRNVYDMERGEFLFGDPIVQGYHEMTVANDMRSGAPMFFFKMNGGKTIEFNTGYNTWVLREMNGNERNITKEEAYEIIINSKPSEW